MFSFFKRSKSRTPSNGEKLLHNQKLLDQDVTSGKNTEQQLSNLNGNGRKLSFHENVNQYQNDTNGDRTFTNFNEKNKIGGGATKNTVEIPAVKKTSIFTEIMAKGRNRSRNKNKNNHKNNNNHQNSNNNNNNHNSNQNDQPAAILNIIDHNNISVNNNSENNSSNDTITKIRINDHIDHTPHDHDDSQHNRNDVGRDHNDEKQNEHFSSSNLFLNNKNDENKNNFVENELNNISNNINFVKTTCSLPSSPSIIITTPGTISADVVSSSPQVVNEVSITPSIDHNNDADFVASLIINKFKMGQPNSKTPTQPEPINNNNNINNNSDNNNNNSNILEDQSDIFYEAADDHNIVLINDKPVLPDLNQLIDIQINECENIPNLDLICNNNDNLIVNHNNNNSNSESDDNISSSDNNSENGSTMIENRILFDLRKELNEIKKHKVTNSNNINNKDEIDNNAFNNVNSDSDKCSEIPKSIIKNKFDHHEKIKKRVTFLPDLVESTSIPPVNDHDDDDSVNLHDDDDNDDNDDDDDDDEYHNINNNNSDEEDDDDGNDDFDVDHKIKINDDEKEEEQDNVDKCKNDYHVEFEASSSEEDLEKDVNDLDDQNSLIIVEEISTSEEDCSIIEDDIIPRDLVNQESRFNEKLEKVENEKIAAQEKLENLEIKIDLLEKEHSIKTWNVERLQAELISAYTEGECVRKRLKQHEEELAASRGRCTELEEEWSTKYDELQTKYDETEQRLDEIKKFCSLLQIQLAEAKSELEKSQKEISDLTEQHEQEQKLIAQAIDSALHDKSESEAKWKKEFEQLRSVNSEREEHLMEDCEWQLRNMQKICKDKVELAEKEKLETLNRAKEIELDANDKSNQVEHLKSFEIEAQQLRRISRDQCESIDSLTKQIENLNTKLQDATERAETEIENMKTMKWQCEMAIYDNQRFTTQKIETETMQIACQWEQKLLEEMSRLTNELNQLHGEERLQAVEEARTEGLKQLAEMKSKYDEIDEQRKTEIASLTKALQNKHTELENSHSQADAQLVQARMFLERAEHEHNTALDREMEKRETLLNELREQHENEKQHLEDEFRERLQHVKDEFAVEITNTTTELTEKHKGILQTQRQQLQKEKDEALRTMEQKYKHKLSDLENKLKEQELSQQRIVDELKSAHKMERSILEQRDHQNNKEIETLHRKCRCLTNLFEEMRMRYERRDPRNEDVREIEELKNRCDQQENDLRNLTERLREHQLLNDQQPNQQQTTAQKNTKNQPNRKNSQPNTKLTPRNNIDVIYEEAEPDNSSTGATLRRWPTDC